MKMLKIITVLVLSLNASLTYANIKSGYDPGATDVRQAKELLIFAPALPAEADFEEVDLSCIIPMPASFFRKVAPVLPRRADFDDDILPVHVGKLIPALPSEADF